MRTTDGAPICACGAVYPIPPMLRAPVDIAARAAGWRVFTGRTYGGAQLDTAMCPACGAPDNTPPSAPPVGSTYEQGTLLTIATRTKLAFAGLAAVVALLLTGGIAHATTGDSDPSIGAIRVVDPCTADQAKANEGRGVLGEHGDAMYRCRETKPGCYQWRWQYDGRPKSGHTWPPRPCPACSPSPSASPSSSHPAGGSASAAASPSGSASKSPAGPAVSRAAPVPVADQLPVTGTATTVCLAVTAVLLIGAGVLLIVVPYITRRRRT